MTVTRADVERAAARIAPFVVPTPVLHADALDSWAGATVFVKAEHRQPGHAFKFRGATNAVQSLTDDDAARGVCAHSSGNHAAALARAAATRGIPCYVVMPRDTKPSKRALVEEFGAHITWCENAATARRAALAEVIERTGAVEIHPFDDERVIAGAGTAALELLAEVEVDVVVTPIGGGGLCSGACVAVAPVPVIGGVPGDRATSRADGLRTGVSERTGAILHAHRVREVVVDEHAISEAERVVRDTLGDVIEPSAAVAFAAARAAQLTGRRVGVISSGANV